ncbi:putative glutamate--cysteine ligase [Bacteriovorax sp. BSW11_IV]|uniref:glutamate--cysteine ligase n=1 Tax=Bacteriovorax sp. BSW11_IV TaxID=1353529 RepID=UPI00038A328F|nr:glutamate--cysteine ligase [Bacteriovorax sp. BSW11_IV]EQC49548.1 putative glutamate--cysteine ligase [Bacteriovorax sp. BSW11_IV]
MTTNYKIQTKDELDQFVCCNWNDINSYIDEKMKTLPRPLYSSVDVRESKVKYAPVDHNIYPAGFNNICLLDLDAATNEFRKVIPRYAPDAKVVGIIPESHTKNTFYLDNIAILGKAIRDAGFEVQFLSFDESLFTEETLNLVSFSGYDLEIHKAKIIDGSICAGEHKTDFVVLNNDQSNPIGLDWNNIKTPIHPSPKIGWFARQKVMHFEFYHNVVNDFCEHFSVNPDLLEARFNKVEDVDFSEKVGIEKIAASVDDLLKDLPEGTNAFVKASQGTYGMGISVVNSGAEVLAMNRKDRNKMDIGKNKIKFTTILVQEGVETILKYDDMPSEVTIYLVDGKSVGGFMRANSERDSKANLNSKGMVFKKFCISEIRQNQDHKCKEAVYSLVARLSTLASCYEIKEFDK